MGNRTNCSDLWAVSCWRTLLYLTIVGEDAVSCPIIVQRKPNHTFAWLDNQNQIWFKQKTSGEINEGGTMLLKEVGGKGTLDSCRVKKEAKKSANQQKSNAPRPGLVTLKVRGAQSAGVHVNVGPFGKTGPLIAEFEEPTVALRAQELRKSAGDDTCEWRGCVSALPAVCVPPVACMHNL